MSQQSQGVTMRQVLIAFGSLPLVVWGLVAFYESDGESEPAAQKATPIPIVDIPPRPMSYEICAPLHDAAKRLGNQRLALMNGGGSLEEENRYRRAYDNQMLNYRGCKGQVVALEKQIRQLTGLDVRLRKEGALDVETPKPTEEQLAKLEQVVASKLGLQTQLVP